MNVLTAASTHHRRGRTTPDFADVSDHQPDVDWDKYAASQRKLAICKATEGTDWVDPTTEGNRTSLGRLGLYCGLYHFAGSSIQDQIKDPVEEAGFYLQNVGPMGPKEFPVLDFERTWGMSPEKQINWVNKWCTEVSQKTGKTPWVYLPTYMLDDWGSADASSLTKYPLWIADINSSDPQNPPDSTPWSSPAAWQYTEHASIPGIGRCDDSYLYADLSKVG